MQVYCKNELEIRGSKYQLEKCIEKISGSNGILDFENICSIPEKIEIIQNETQDNPVSAKEQFYMLDNFLANYLSLKKKDKTSVWQIQNWGVYGNAKDPKLSWVTYRGKPSISIRFLTNTRSPRKVIQRLAEMFPLLVFVLHTEEYGFDLDETYRFTNGKMAKLSMKYKE